MDSFVITKDGHHMDIIDGSYVKLLNFAYKGTKPSTVVMKTKNEEDEEMKVVLCTLTPEHPQYFAEIIVAGDCVDFELIGNDEITVYMDIDFDDQMDFDDDQMDFGDMEEDEEEDDDDEIEEVPVKQIPKKEEKKPQPPKEEKKQAPKKEEKKQNNTNKQEQKGGKNQFQQKGGNNKDKSKGGKKH